VKPWQRAAATVGESKKLAGEVRSYVPLPEVEPVLDLVDRPTGLEPSEACPYAEASYSQDAINNLCKRYTDPPFHCTVHRLTSSLGNEHVVIEVPEGIASRFEQSGVDLKAPSSRPTCTTSVALGLRAPPLGARKSGTCFCGVA
jgi:hypothetical protein